MSRHVWSREAIEVVRGIEILDEKRSGRIIVARARFDEDLSVLTQLVVEAFSLSYSIVTATTPDRYFTAI